MSTDEDLQTIHTFLGCPTPSGWLARVDSNLEILMIDHAHCEKKAASTAINLLFRYVDRPELLRKLSQLAREELLHFEQVLDLMAERGVEYQHLERDAVGRENSEDAVLLGVTFFIGAHPPHPYWVNK